MATKRDDIPCWDLCNPCGASVVNESQLDIYTDPHYFMEFIAAATPEFSMADPADTVYYEAALDAKPPVYRLAQLDENGDPVDRPPPTGYTLTVESMTVQTLRDFQRAVNAIKYATGAAMQLDAANTDYNVLLGFAGEMPELAYRAATAFVMPTGASPYDLWAFLLDEALKSVPWLLAALQQLLDSRDAAVAGGVGAYAKVHTEPEPFAERFYRTIGRVAVSGALLEAVIGSLTTSLGYMGPVTHVATAEKDMITLGG